MVKIKEFREIMKPAFDASTKFDAMPGRITDQALDKLALEQILICGSQNFQELLIQMREAYKKEGSVIELPRDYKVSFEESNQLIKALHSRDTINITSMPVIRAMIGEDSFMRADLEKKLGPEQKLDNPTWSAKLAEAAEFFPYELLSEGVNLFRDNEKQKIPIAITWYGSDKCLRALSWIRAVEGAQLFARSNDKNYSETIILDKKLYGNNLVNTTVIGPDGKYNVELRRLPIFEDGDPRQHSAWVDLSGSCDCKDTKYRAKAHQKRKHPTYLFCKHQIAAFYKVIQRLGKTKEKGNRQIRTNPFVIPDQFAMNLVNFLAERAIMSGKRPVNKTEINHILGMYVLNKNNDKDIDFSKTFYGWGKRKNIDYLK